MLRDTPANPVAARFGPREKRLLQECIHCGFCLPACPTYVINGMEMDSPRGRLYLMEAAMGNRVTLSDPFVKHMDRCLVCRACETVCPSGVQFGDLMGKARAAISPARRDLSWKTSISRFGLRKVIPSHASLSLFVRGAWTLQRTGLMSLLSRFRLRNATLERIGQLQEMLPRLRFRRFGRARTRLYPASGRRRGKVTLFSGCVMDHLYPQVHAATVRILTWNGYDVAAPGNQTCCGALHVHNGEETSAAKLAEKTVHRLHDPGSDAIVVNAAGCGAHLKEYGKLYGKPYLGFSEKIRDLTEFLATVDLSIPEKPLSMRVAYDDACHLVHAQGISREPRFLITSIPGLKLEHLEEADRCCGSAGIYSITEPDLSLEVLNRKMKHIENAGVEAVVTANPGCQIQLDWGIRRKNLKVDVLHIAELLDRAYSADPRYRRRHGIPAPDT